MILRKKYWLYYFLTFLAGARRQIFVTFAVFLLVKKFTFSVQEVTILFVVNNAINFFLTPQIGKVIIHYGERKILTVEYSTLIAVFIAYAYVESKWIVTILYIVDHIVFNFSDVFSKGRGSQGHCPQYGGWLYNKSYCRGGYTGNWRACLDG